MVLHQEVKLGERKHNRPSGDCESTKVFIIVLFLDKAAAQITAMTLNDKWATLNHSVGG